MSSGKCFRDSLSLTNPRISPLTIKYEWFQTILSIITFDTQTNKVDHESCNRSQSLTDGGPVLQQPVPLSKLDPMSLSLHAFMVCLSGATHQMLVHLEQHTADKLSRCDRASVDRWFLVDRILTEEAGVKFFLF